MFAFTSYLLLSQQSIKSRSTCTNLLAVTILWVVCVCIDAQDRSNLNENILSRLRSLFNNTNKVVGSDNQEWEAAAAAGEPAPQVPQNQTIPIFRPTEGLNLEELVAERQALYERNDTQALESHGGLNDTQRMSLAKNALHSTSRDSNLKPIPQGVVS